LLLGECIADRPGALLKHIDLVKIAEFNMEISVLQCVLTAIAEAVAGRQQIAVACPEGKFCTVFANDIKLTV
jgi:hypothetical protein